MQFFVVEKNGMHWLGQGSNIGLNEKQGKYHENKIITDRHTYIVNERYPIMLLETPF